MRPIIKLLLLFFCGYHIAFCQFEPKKFNAKGTYFHKKTNLPFPDSIFGFKRVRLVKFDRRKTDIGVSYENQEVDAKKTKITAYLYPAGAGYEGRLRNTFQLALEEMELNFPASKTKVKASVIEKKGQKFHKISGEIKGDLFNLLSLYECGSWFLKIRITGPLSDSSLIAETEQKLIAFWPLEQIIESFPLSLKPSIEISRQAASDKLLLYIATGMPLKKIAWANNNVDSLEMRLGFPDFYMDMHKETFLFFANKSDTDLEKHKVGASEMAKDYLHQLQTIGKSNYLDIFLNDFYGGTLVGKSSTAINLEGYEVWKKENNINMNKFPILYQIVYPESK